ncbi:DarT ssDNA thymidine ADP-ribosyltransferase family protein [Enterobacter sp.]|uniref:DarT ssDNA thymidine ADP-ribosyltransferase family protein n=1 Tax=Enterobacter sp. TaxID=42895 RepID=UPI00296F3958|nr:DarT ssDNA thymidine ADP-ribosyltransferase family protein [Enterobacter sp.]
MRNSIQQIVTQRDIKCLIHFTRVENLESIMANGIIPVATARHNRMPILSNDAFRWDGHPNASCLSITFPNSMMFYKCRNADRDADWVVLGIQPSVMSDKNCAFCRRNAATREISGQPLEILQTPAALEGMFEEIDGFSTRQAQGLRPNHTTDVQAEVLVFDTIEPRYIIGAVFNKQDVKTRYEGFLEGKQSHLQGINSGYFNRR